jgi:hypothetical protein
LTNPSNITITIGDINFDVYMNEYNAIIGKAYMLDTTIKPGAQDYNSVMHLAEGATNAEAVGKMLYYYLTGAAVPLTIEGSASSSTIVPLQQGLSQLKLATSINGVTEGLIKSIDIVVDINTLGLNGGFADATIIIYNPLDTEFALKHITASCTSYLTCKYAGSLQYTTLEIGTLDYTFTTPLVIPAKGTAQTGIVPVHIDISKLDAIMADLGAMKGLYNVTQTASVVVGDQFETDQMVYAQQNVHYTISMPPFPDQFDPTWQAICDSDPPGSLQPMSLTLNTTTVDNSTTVASTTSSSASSTSSSVTITTTDITTTTEQAQATTTETTSNTTTENSVPTTTTDANTETTTNVAATPTDT